jgi:hypothetical protein
MASFEEILSKKSSDVRSPQAYPVGTYHCLVEGPPEPGQSSQKQALLLRYKFKILAPDKDVDAAQAAEQQIVGKTFTDDFYIESGDWRLKEFLKDCLGIDGLEGTPQEKTFKEMIAESPGKQVLVKLRHEMSRDGKRVFHRVDSYAHV